MIWHVWAGRVLKIFFSLEYCVSWVAWREIQNYTLASCRGLGMQLRKNQWHPCDENHVGEAMAWVAEGEARWRK